MQSYALGTIERNAVLRNTYALLSMTLLWSALCGVVGMAMHFTFGSSLLLMLAGFAALFATMALRNSGWGVLMVFVFTGIEGLSLGPVLGHYAHMPHGGEILGMAAGLTGVSFLALSGYVLATRKNFDFLGGFLFMALIGLILVGLVGAVFHLPGVQLALSFVTVLVFSGYILFDTSRIVNGGQRNYIMATVDLYLNILNLFLAFLRIANALRR